MNLTGKTIFLTNKQKNPNGHRQLSIKNRNLYRNCEIRNPKLTPAKILTIANKVSVWLR